jgi:ABC-type Fe3+ transport system substrate-binding protein
MPNFKNKQNLKIVVEGDRRLVNQYGVMLVNPAKHPHVKRDLSRKLIDWSASPAGQHAIANYKISGAQLFFQTRKVRSHKLRSWPVPTTLSIMTAPLAEISKRQSQLLALKRKLV